MILKEILVNSNDQKKITCKACGSCCPSYCSLKKGNLCANHPDNPKAKSNIRGQNCDIDPLYLFLYGIFCPSVMERINEIISKKIRLTSEVDPRNGVRFITGTIYSPSGLQLVNPLNTLMKVNL